MTRKEAEQILQKRFGIKHFYDEQWLVIDKILHGEKVLMVERTGFGKSLCYQFPAIMFSNLTVVFSPLIALMRDQVSALSRKGIPAACINSEQPQEANTKAIEDAIAGKLTILYIAPERQENLEWLKVTKDKIKLSMIVIDEAHTISVWGHDFRPSFRRIVNLVRIHDKKNIPVLAVTATATSTVQEDIQKQIGGPITHIRGNLVRENFRLRVIKVKSEEEKMIWLKHNLNSFSGTGIIYAGTRVQSETYAKWLAFNGINCVHYNAGLDPVTRMHIERGLMANQWKCVISTNALGMGIDKPDIRFIIHLQVPASPIHYYQEIGRAGRDGLPTDAVLLYNDSIMDDGIEADIHLPLSFINGSKPSIDKYERVISAVKESLRGQKEICIKCNLKQTEFNVIKQDLIEQKIIHEVVMGNSKKYASSHNAPGLDTERFQKLRNAKLSDLESMREYIYTDRPRMEFLCSFLGDEKRDNYGQCDNTTIVNPGFSITDVDRRLYKTFVENTFPAFSFKPVRGVEVKGVAASYYGVSTVGDAIHRCKYDNGGDFPLFLVRLTLKAFHKSFPGQHFDYIVFVPPTKSGNLVKNFSLKIGQSLQIPVKEWVVKNRQTKEQKIFRNRYGKEENVKDAFFISESASVRGKRFLLIDDILDSGWTLREISKVLIQAGAISVAPLVIAKTVSNDLD